MSWKGKFLVLVLTGVLAGAFLFHNDPRFIRVWSAVSTHARGIAKQVQHDYHGVQDFVDGLSKGASAGR